MMADDCPGKIMPSQSGWNIHQTIHHGLLVLLVLVLGLEYFVLNNLIGFVTITLSSGVNLFPHALNSILHC